MSGLFVSQFLGSFNDNAWKQIVIFLAIAAAATAEMGQEHTAIAQIVLIIPLMLISMPAGVLADRVSKRTIIVGTKVFELALMLAGVAVLIARPEGGPLALAILGLLGVQAALFGPAKYGIIPELVPHERLSAANGLIEMGSNLAMLGGMVAGAVILQASRSFGPASWPAGLIGGAAMEIQAVRYLPAPLWMGGLLLAALSACGLLAALKIPRVARSAVRGRTGHDRAHRLGGHPRRSRAEADRHRSDPGMGDRQPGARAAAALRLEDPGPAGVAGQPAPGRPGAGHRGRVRAGRTALGAEGRIRAPPAGRPGPHRLHAGLCAR